MEARILSERAFTAISDVNLDVIKNLSSAEIRFVLPFLTRIVCWNPLDTSEEWMDKRKQIQQILSDIEAVNSIVALLSCNFSKLEIDVKKEQQLKSKIISGYPTESVLITNLTDGLALEFERADGVRKLRLLLSELISLMSYVRNIQGTAFNFQFKSSELFDNQVYFDEVCDVLSIVIAELPNTIQLLEVVETLLHIKNGPLLICRLVANAPESFNEVCNALLNNGEKQDEESYFGMIRMKALRMLCKMNPSHSLIVRSEAIELCRMPGLTIALTLDFFKRKQQDYLIDELVAFISGILLGNDDKVRSWFASYIRNGQKRMDLGVQTTFSDLRSELLKSLKLSIQNIENGNDSDIVQASMLLRLYCALRGIASMKLSEDEANALINLITCHPPPSAASIRFITLGLCILLVSPQLITNSENERKAVAWINWLVNSENHFGKIETSGTSFCEMLLLLAIHFHGNQMNAISELVSTTTGMKLSIRQNNLARIKTIFTQEIFTDQIVTAHAVRVSVTPSLNNNVTGFLPVHCIYQLLKSRAFTKHKVPIKDWIFKQICNATAPVHMILPPLIEAYVNSVIVPSSKTASHTTNEPISEQSILKIFKHKVYSFEETEESQAKMEVDDEETAKCALTSQLLLLYYVLLYEDSRLSNMKTIIISDRKVLKYSSEFLSQLPIFYLLQKARIDQQNYGVLLPSLLRLVAFHYPHLCLVQDWLVSEKKINYKQRNSSSISVSEEKKNFILAFESQSNSLMICALEKLLTLPTNYLWPIASDFVSKLPVLFSNSISRLVIEKTKKVWWKLNSVFPRKLWVMTVNALKPKLFLNINQNLTWTDVVLDPLNVLRCDDRVFRNPALMDITLHMLNAFLAASRTYLSHHLLERPSKSGEEEKDREELRIALLAAQESAAVQILLECCLITEDDVKSNVSKAYITEVQNLICSHLHQTFILDPNIAKLVHFQGYSSELLPLAVTNIPSMHICLDFIPELLSQPDLSKQVII